ncbi:MAG: phosphoribosylaminoimidazolesuccinocarboxamide synthase [Myxococcales bacterium]|nr:phosphoribosylaminoimidazolesuccinocarboxamide synthase [Myxococcales bacterium]
MPVSRELIRQAIADDLILDSLPAEFDGLGQRYSGKVRENFSLANGERLIVVSDRVSAFDRVLGTIPFKGQVLNGLAAHWFETTASLFPNHMLAVPDAAAMRVVECEPFKIEMVVRGYLTGSSSTSIWRAYEKGERRFCGHTLPEGLQRHQQLAANIVTPTTKAAKGDHDQNISKAALVEQGLIDGALFDVLEQRCLALFAEGQRQAAARGLILVDTKYELGRRADGEIVLIDEIHTPDSSRYWYAEGYQQAMAEGRSPRALDKEFVRTWLVDQGFTGDGTPPTLPDEIRVEAALRYIEAFERVTGREFEPDMRPPLPRLRAALGV